MDDVTFRRASAADAEQVAAVYLASRRAFVSFAPLVHSDAEVRQWVAGQLIPAGGVTVAVVGAREGTVVGMMAVSRKEGAGWLDHLYLLPSSVGRGLGAQLVQRAKAALASPVRLYTFQANEGARRFYERHGFRAIGFGDGSSNEERCPDVLYEWTETSGTEAPARSAR
jgi:ribosomal protein S18 acetylase RimI-like enzyme